MKVVTDELPAQTAVLVTPVAATAEVAAAARTAAPITDLAKELSFIVNP